jgi:hypothetical protein
MASSVTPIDDRFAPEVLIGQHPYCARPRDEHLVEV